MKLLFLDSIVFSHAKEITFSERHEQSPDKKLENDMTSAISSFASKAYESIPRFRIDTPANMIKKVTLVAIPAILVFGSQYAVQGANGGPIAWAACIAACEAIAAAATVATAGAAAPSLMACVTACGPIFALPFPPEE